MAFMKKKLSKYFFSSIKTRVKIEKKCCTTLQRLAVGFCWGHTVIRKTFTETFFFLNLEYVFTARYEYSFSAIKTFAHFFKTFPLGKCHNSLS